MKKIIFIFAVTTMMAASNHTATAQNIYIDATNTNEPQVQLTNDTISIILMTENPDALITEILYRPDASEPWAKEKPLYPSSHFTLKIPMSKVAGNQLVYMIVEKSKNQISCMDGEIRLNKPFNGYGVRSNGQKLPMW